MNMQTAEGNGDEDERQTFGGDSSLIPAIHRHLRAVRCEQPAGSRPGLFDLTCRLREGRDRLLPPALVLEALDRAKSKLYITLSAE